MAQTLRTKCPACETTFALSPEQLAARDGLVRCGRCSIVFRADRYLVAAKRTRSKSRAPRTAAKTAASKPARRPPAPPRAVAPAPAQLEPQPEFLSPLLARLLGGRRPSYALPLLWGVGTLALALALAAQGVFFYASELADYRALRPWVTAACQHLGCEIRPRQDVAAIELLRTSVAPHPEEANALRIRIAMVNRAAFTQPYPLLEFSLTDSAGTVVARRTFAVHHYVRGNDALTGMIPHVVVEGTLDVTNPDSRGGGYEIRLVAR